MIAVAHDLPLDTAHAEALAGIDGLEVRAVVAAPHPR
jgi:hypothetical protein